MNWGNKLMLVFIVFALLIGTLVYKSINTKYDLVSKDYYKDELRYQERIDQTNNANEISAVSISQDNSYLIIQLPKEQSGVKTEGEILMYCKTNADNDVKFILQTDSNGKQIIDKNKIRKGAYQLKLTWQTASQKFYNQHDILIK
jgi:hypothetical protein